MEAPVEAVMHGLAVADMDGDGQQDMVTARMHQGAPPQEVSVYLNTGRGNSWKKVTVSERGSHDILVADFNGHGRPDILGANHGGSHQPVELWLNRGPIKIQEKQSRAAMRIWVVDDGVRINPQTGQAFEAPYLPCGPASQALIPLDAGVNAEFGMPFDLPDRTNAVPGQKVQGIWMDVFIPPDPAPGTYEGAIEVTGLWR